MIQGFVCRWKGDAGNQSSQARTGIITQGRGKPDMKEMTKGKIITLTPLPPEEKIWREPRRRHQYDILGHILDQRPGDFLRYGE